MENKKTNTYSYSSSENEEIKRIREKYEFKKEENSKLEQLRKLDESVRITATMVSISVGVIGVLLFGLGLSFILVWANSLFVAGIINGISGIILIAMALPVYNMVENKKMKKIAPEIIRLTDELMK